MRERAEEFGQLGLRVPKLLDRMAENVDRIEALVGPHRPSLRFVDFGKSKEHVEPIAFFGALGRAPVRIDLSERQGPRPARGRRAAAALPDRGLARFFLADRDACLADARLIFGAGRSSSTSS